MLVDKNFSGNIDQNMVYEYDDENNAANEIKASHVKDETKNKENQINKTEFEENYDKDENKEIEETVIINEKKNNKKNKILSIY